MQVINNRAEGRRLCPVGYFMPFRVLLQYWSRTALPVNSRISTPRWISSC